MTQPRIDTITVEISGRTAELLATLCDGYFPTVPDVLMQLIDHAQQGVYHPGAWERDWLIQVFGTDFLARLEPDDRPEQLSADGRVIFDRPRQAQPPRKDTK